jgi:hypothetical protein
MRNMIDVNKRAFSLLIEQFLQLNKKEVGEGKRFISTNDEEKEWIKSAKINDFVYITPTLRIIQIKFEGKLYFAAIGSQLDTTLLDVSVLKELDLNAGVISILLSEGLIKLDKKSNNLEFYDNILFQHQESGYKGHNFTDLIAYLEDIYFFEVPEYSIVKSDWTSRVACYIYSKNSSQLILDFDENVTDFISELSLVGSDNISYKIVLSSLFSNTYKHAFLELYRLIERLFPISYLKEFHSVTDTKLKFLDFVIELETITKWRPREDEAIEKIFINSKASTRNYFKAFHSTSASLQSQNDYTFFYSLRNSIVHFRANHLELELTNKQWNLLLNATLFLIDEQYSANNEMLE